MAQSWRRISGIAIAVLAYLGTAAGCATQEEPEAELTDETDTDPCEGLLILSIDSVRLDWAGEDCALKGHIVQHGTSRDLSCSGLDACSCDLRYTDGQILDFSQPLTLQLVLNESTEFAVEGETLRARLTAASNTCSGRTVEILESEGVPLNNGLGGFGGEGGVP